MCFQRLGLVVWPPQSHREHGIREKSPALPVGIRISEQKYNVKLDHPKIFETKGLTWAIIFKPFKSVPSLRKVSAGNRF